MDWSPTGEEKVKSELKASQISGHSNSLYSENFCEVSDNRDVAIFLCN